MRFSIATPTRNSLPSLKRCVGSVRGQSHAAREHLIQDAVSEDGASEWLESQPGLCWKSEPDGGMYDAINRSWSRADGDVLSWLNADEQYLPHTLETVAGVFAEHPEVDAVFGDTIIVDNDGSPVSARREIPLRSLYVRNGFLYALSCSLFFRRSLRDKGLLEFDTSYRVAGDMDLALRLLAAGCRFLHIPHYLALFTVTGTNLSLDPRMVEETEAIRDRHGQNPCCIVRRAIMFGRHVEKLVRGCYAMGRVSYEYALDEEPRYRHVEGRRVPSLFTYDSYLKKRRS